MIYGGCSGKDSISVESIKNMESNQNHKILEFIGKNPITINTDYYSHPYLEKIVGWIKLVEDYGEKLKIPWEFIGLDDYKEKNLFQDQEKFTIEMRNASFGIEYSNWKISPGLLHDYGETWTYDQLVLASNTGLVWWYCKKLSKDAYEEICKNYPIQLLGAFFHRVKIILENVNKLLNFLFNGKQFNNFTLEQIFKLDSSTHIKKNPKVYTLTKYIIEVSTNRDKFFKNYVNIEKFIDLAQLNIFLIILHH
jgi:hypothetical protein